MVYSLRGRRSRPFRVEVRLSESELEQMNALCGVMDKSAAALIRAALALYAANADAESVKLDGNRFQQQKDSP
jgi:hypothetical protein